MPIAPVPDDQPLLAPHLVVRDGPAAIAFYIAAFGATERFRLSEPSGKLGHAELMLGGALVMVADEYPDFGALSPASIGGTPVRLHLYVTDVDAAIAHAVSLGATLLRAPRDEFYGDRAGMVVDPFGHVWHLATRREAVSPAEMQRRWDAMMQG